MRMSWAQSAETAESAPHVRAHLSVDQRLTVRAAERDLLIRRIQARLRGDRRVLAAWLTGSSGTGSTDALSDIDLWVVVIDDQFDAVDAGRMEDVAALGPALLVDDGPHAPAGGTSLVVLYPGDAGPHRIDWYWQRQSTARVPADALVLFDRVGIPPAASEERRLPPTPSSRALVAASLTASFWSLATTAAKKAARGQPWLTLTRLRQLSAALAEVRWLVGAGTPPPMFGFHPPFPPPASPSAQLAALREMAREMETTLMPLVEAMGGTVSWDVVPQIYDFIDLCEDIVEEERGKGEMLEA
jgi:predicted nucleotidyltransferase